MLSRADISQIVEDCKENGYDIKVRDIMYVILCRSVSYKEGVYKSLFGNTDGYGSYENDGKIQFLSSFLEHNEKSFSNEKKKQRKNISFEENLDGMIELLQATQEARENGEIEKDKALKIESDLRIRLQSSFKVADEHKDQVVIVEHKYSDVCKNCGHEIPLPTKEKAMKIYNLIEKD